MGGRCRHTATRSEPERRDGSAGGTMTVA